ncbi:ribose-phosphate pyrophosphokinase [Malonomonas rubra DSM 5091]|uniref:Ribose-phosphate pyrophosphokinase n=1 Tax=Malonomonas rubra DSM 5091 TaxID=1122189 RepID=A0A1M6E442_MALRU|nr:ribose-phosphate pyrophosphokinase [Malonomonas rubra]SHI80221.1 ribose-phosphate pyrophosphokinase [Malonomonas rubra DSM 5091]
MIKVFTGNSNEPLAQEICQHLGVRLGDAKVKTFSDGEVMVEISENVRGRDAYVIQSTCAPANNHLMEMLVMVDALKRASAARINAVVPYFGYARQDRKVAPRAPISAKLVADLMSVAGVDRVLTMDLHAGQIQGFFDIPVDHLYAAPVLLEEIRKVCPNSEKLMVVSPDAGGTERARAFAKRLDAGLAIIDKRRSGPNVSEVMHIIGDVKGKSCVIIDDMIDTAGTLCAAATALQNDGSGEVFACATHGVLSGPALQRIEDSPLEQVIITNSIPAQNKIEQCSKLKGASVSKLLSEAIRRIHNDESVSSLFV